MLSIKILPRLMTESPSEQSGPGELPVLLSEVLERPTVEGRERGSESSLARGAEVAREFFFMEAL